MEERFCLHQKDTRPDLVMTFSCSVLAYLQDRLVFGQLGNNKYVLVKWEGLKIITKCGFQFNRYRHGNILSEDIFCSSYSQYTDAYLSYSII